MSDRNHYQPQASRYPPTLPNMNYGPPPPPRSSQHTTRRRSHSRSARYNRPRSRSRSHSRRRRFSRSRSADLDRRRGRRSFSYDRPRRYSRSRSRSFKDGRDGPRDRLEKGYGHGHGHGRGQRDRMRSRERFDDHHGSGRRSRSAPMDYRRPSRSRSRGRSLSRDDRRHSRHSPHRRHEKGRSKSHASSRSYSRSRSSTFSGRRGNRSDRRQYRNEDRIREDSCERSQNDEALGVVSDDENMQKKNSHKSNGVDINNRDDDRDERRRKRKKKAKRKRSRDRDRDHERDRQKNEGRRKRDEDRYGRKRKGQGSSGGSASSHDRDDTFGHFKGGPGAVINGRYKLVKDVGLGTFGRVVQAIDLNLARNVTRDERQNHRDRDRNDRKAKIKMEDSVAIKIVRNVKRYHESALIEADILKDVNSRGGRGQSLCGVLLRQFDLNGHCCLVFECLGRSLYDFMKVHGFKSFPLFCVHDFAKQLLDALDFIHSFGLIHTDLKPENILLKSNKERPYRLPDGVSDQQVPASTCIKLVDFGGATYDREKKSTIINTRQYRAPEVILGVGWSIPSDLWSAGCIISELYKGELLFATHDNSEHLALIERIIGRIPLNMVTRSKDFGTRLFDSDGWHKMEDLSSGSKAHVRRAAVLEMNVKEKDTHTKLASLLRSLLTIDPDHRSSAANAMKNPFFSNNGNVRNI